MAETHKEVVKVWIAPGCIVCDACETDSPKVFEVQEETCIIRPEALSADFTQPLTPSIIIAAEGCPVDVIKFDTIEVEGPEPWAGQEEEAAKETAGAAAGGGGSKGTPIPEGPPDPKWAGLLSTAYTSGSRSAGGPGVWSRQAKAPAEAVAVAVGRGAPPDAMAAAMVGSGYARPDMSVSDRILEKAGLLASAAKMTRRQFSTTLAIAWGAMAATFATAGAALQSFMVPKVTKEPPSVFRAGTVADYAEPGVYEQFKGKQGVWIVHQANGELVAISTTCTHLGCIPNWLQSDQKFKCPCHGSGFYVSGVNFEGPAPRPLERYKIAIEGEYIVVDKSKKFRQELGQWTLPGASITV
jgi:cytochrome b6-f complex iron-sulfur subunit